MKIWMTDNIDRLFCVSWRHGPLPATVGQPADHPPLRAALLDWAQSNIQDLIKVESWVRGNDLPETIWELINREVRVSWR